MNRPPKYSEKGSRFSKEPLEAVRLFISIYSNPALSWEKLFWLKGQIRLPILIKGILRPDDALQAVASGNDFELTARLAGCRNLAEIDADMVSRYSLK